MVTFEYTYPAGLGSHHVKKIEKARAWLSIVGQVEMGIVEFIVAGLRACRRRLKSKSTASDPIRANRYAKYKESLLIFTTSVHFVFCFGAGTGLMKIMRTRMGAATHPH
jgi:hypothetical protein